MLGEGSRKGVPRGREETEYWESVVALKNSYYIPDYKGNWVPTGLWIPMTGLRIPGSGFRIPNSKICRIPDSGSPFMGRNTK